VLTGTGIASVQLMVANPTTAPGNGQPFDPTFNYYAAATPTSVPITSGMVLAGLDPAKNAAALARCQALNLSVTGRYVLLGIGPRNSMVGKTIQTPAGAFRRPTGPQPRVWLRAARRHFLYFGYQHRRDHHPGTLGRRRSDPRHGNRQHPGRASELVSANHRRQLIGPARTIRAGRRKGAKNFSESC